MEAEFNRRIIVSIGGTVAAIGIVVGLYMFGIRPMMKEWNEVRVELKNRSKRLKELRGLFSNQDDPRVEIRTLTQEIENLEDANAAFNKIKKPGVETIDLPEELRDPDPQIALELHRDYIKEVMSVAEENIKKDMKSAELTPPDFELYTQLEHPGEAAYYLNRAGGLQGLINAMITIQSESDKKIVVKELVLEDYKEGINRRSAAGNVLSYFLPNMTTDMQSLLSFVYNLQEEDGYYFVEEMTIKPTRAMSSSENPGLSVDARINTVMIYKSEVMKEIKRVAKESTVAKTGGASSGKVTGLLGLAEGMKRMAARQARRAKEKKWYEFWK